MEKRNTLALTTAATTLVAAVACGVSVGTAPDSSGAKEPIGFNLESVGDFKVRAVTDAPSGKGVTHVRVRGVADPDPESIADRRASKPFDCRDVKTITIEASDSNGRDYRWVLEGVQIKADRASKSCEAKKPGSNEFVKVSQGKSGDIQPVRALRQARERSSSGWRM